MKYRVFSGGGFASNTYLLTDDCATAAAVIDPSVPYRTVRAALGAMPPVRYLLLTHAHFDHMMCLDEWRRETGAPLALSAAEAPGLQLPQWNLSLMAFGHAVDYGKADLLLQDGEELRLGEETVQMVLVPGHTTGGCAYAAGDALFVGDTVFADGGIGRCDFFGGDETVLRASVQRLLAYPPGTRLYPGHGPSTTVGDERPFHSY